MACGLKSIDYRLRLRCPFRHSVTSIGFVKLVILFLASIFRCRLTLPIRASLPLPLPIVIIPASTKLNSCMFSVKTDGVQITEYRIFLSVLRTLFSVLSISPHTFPCLLTSEYLVYCPALQLKDTQYPLTSR